MTFSQLLPGECAIMDSAAAPEEQSQSMPISEVDAGQLRERVLQHLRSQGFQINGGRLISPVTEDKDQVRGLHLGAVELQRAKSKKGLLRLEDSFIAKLAHGRVVDASAIEPVLVPIFDRRSFDGLLWRWCSLHWSIPVSSGYGRRLRFLVLDARNDGKVIGLIGLGDPVFALGARDAWIGWDRATRGERLANVMDAFVLGAVPPYRELRAGKLVALLATSTFVRDAFALKYGVTTTRIAQRNLEANLALVTTTSALGRSSVYNRLRADDGTLAYTPVGYTAGTGDFHLSGKIYDDLSRFVASINTEKKTHVHRRWRTGTGRNRREVIQLALEGLGLDARQLRYHGVKRQVFVAPLMSNTQQFLVDGAAPIWSCRSVEEHTRHWLNRWARPRAERDESWRDFNPDTWRLYT